MDSIQPFLIEIEMYLQAAGISHSTFGRKAVNDGSFVARVRAGANLTIKTIARVRQYMADHPPSTQNTSPILNEAAE
jgi:hypothetical protein